MTGQATLRLLLFVAAVVIGTDNPAAALTVLYSFAGGTTDVQNPQPFGDIVLGSNGNFYGTAPSGGVHGQGGVFEITPVGFETVPYSFKSTNNPTCQPGLNKYNANYFIGTCYGPVAGSGGGIYSVTPSGTYHLIHKFTGFPLDGANPDGPPIKVGPITYGTTAYGGANNFGTIYKRVGTTVTIMYSFTGGADGKYPAATLLHELYGTTCTPSTVCLDGSAEGGGGSNCGTIFQFLPPSGPFAVLYTFTCSPGDGTAPIGALIQPDKNGPLYGTTYEGGANNEGIVFRLTQTPIPPYSLTLMHSFAAATDGAGPQAALVADGNYLYGTCINGGNPGGWLSQGEGSIFKIKMSGLFPFTTLHLFAGGTTDGSNPAGGLVLKSGLLYGDTVQGGTSNDGVFYNQAP